MILLGRCDGCGAGYFPPRVMCPRCGGVRWTSEGVTRGVVEEVTTVRRAVGDAVAEPRVLATIRLPDDQRVIAGSSVALEVGASVTLSDDAGAVRVRPTDEPGDDNGK